MAEGVIVLQRLSNRGSLHTLRGILAVIQQIHLNLPSSRNALPLVTLSQAISAKLEDGKVRAAVHLLMSQDSPAVPSPESLQTLHEKHPPAI